jgi:hypothetical protein
MLDVDCKIMDDVAFIPTLTEVKLYLEDDDIDDPNAYVVTALADDVNFSVKYGKHKIKWGKR